MKVILGLGNPGREYAATRHNVGWWLVDHLAGVWRFDGWKKDGESQVSTGVVEGVKTRLVKPQTFMNLSGQALRNYIRAPFWSAANDLLVVVDEVQLPVGRFRIRARGSA
ncbi:MAG: aminoacyl-tRNA hydrolase, partial [Thermoanaerobaculia bacterium]